MNTRGLIGKAVNAYRKEGLSYLLKEGSKMCSYLIKNGLILGYYRICKSNEFFEFNGNRYRYFYSLYGATWNTERSIEIPIVWTLVDKSYSEKKRVLEVGNVLSYRFYITHDVVDKYDKIDHVINEDILDYNPPYKYDLIVSISTLEHVGYDEEIKDPTKIIKSIKNLKRLLNSNGKLVVTLPLGQNIEMDKLIAQKILAFDKMFYMKREKGNKWIQMKEINPCSAIYNYQIPTANAIVIGISNAPLS